MMAALDASPVSMRLRREREKRGISLDSLAEITNVSVDLWIGLVCLIEFQAEAISASIDRACAANVARA